MNKRAPFRLKARFAITLIEVLLALTIFVLFVGGIFYLAVETRNQSARQQLKSEALTYAQEGLEAARYIRDENYWDLTDGAHGLSRVGSVWSFSGTSENIDQFYTRTVTVDSVYRDASGDIAETGTLDPLTKRITSEVTWMWRGILPQSVELTTYFANWRGDQWQLTTCTEFNTGSFSSTGTVAASEPPVDNCVVSLTLAEQMGTFYHSVNVGEHGDDVAVSGTKVYLAVSKTAEGLAVVDITDPDSASVLTHKDVNGKGRTVRISGSTLYMGVDSNTKGLAILDVSTPSSPVIRSTTNVGAAGNGTYLVGNYLYIGTEASSNSFRVYNVSNPASPTFVGQYNVGSATRTIQVSGSYAYVGTSSSSSGFKILNVSNPASITSVSSLNLGAGVRSILVNGTVAYVGLSTGTNSLKIVNIANPAAPVVLSTLSLGAVVQDMERIGNYLYLALDQENPGMAIVNVSNAASPYVSFNVDVGGKGTGVTLDSEFAYISLDTSNKGLVLNGQAEVGVASSGTYTSPIFDTGSESTHYNYLDWDASTEAGSTLWFQLRTASSSGGLSSATWVGPDGTASTYYDTPPQVITLSASRTGQRYVQIRAYYTSDGENSVSLETVTLDYQP